MKKTKQLNKLAVMNGIGLLLLSAFAIQAIADESRSQNVFKVTGTSHGSSFPEYDLLASEAAANLQQSALQVCGDAVEVGPRTVQYFRRSVRIDSFYSCLSNNTIDSVFPEN